MKKILSVLSIILLIPSISALALSPGPEINFKPYNSTINFFNIETNQEYSLNLYVENSTGFWQDETAAKVIPTTDPADYAPFVIDYQNWEVQSGETKPLPITIQTDQEVLLEEEVGLIFYKGETVSSADELTETDRVSDIIDDYVGEPFITLIADSTGNTVPTKFLRASGPNIKWTFINETEEGVLSLTNRHHQPLTFEVISEPESYTLEFSTFEIPGDSTIEIPVTFTADTTGTYDEILHLKTNEIAENNDYEIHLKTEVYSMFPDVPLTHQNADDIYDLMRQGVFTGHGDGTFKPEDGINRAELSKVLVVGGLFKDPTIEEYNNCFSDIGDTEWYVPYVCFLSEINVIDGYPDGTFRPEQKVNKAEAVKMILNTSGISDILLDLDAEHMGLFDDVPADEWFTPFVELAKSEDIISDSGNNFYPGDYMTRGTVAEVLNNAMNYYSFFY